MDKTLRQKFPRKTMGEFGNKARARLRHPSNRAISGHWTDLAAGVEASRIVAYGDGLTLEPVTMQPAASSSNLPSS